MTQLLKARNGVITPEMETILESEPISRDALLKGVGDGTIVVLANPAHVKMGGVPLAIGKGTRIKVNANLGTSQDDYRMAQEKAKLEASLKAKADTVMDLSTGGDLNAIRRTLINDCPVPFGTVPIYQAEADIAARKGSFLDLVAEDLLSVIENQARDGVDFMTIHAGIRLRGVEHLRSSGRLTGVVSRGGGLLASWMLHHRRENPLFERFDDVLDICRSHDVTISLGDALRPGSLHDATDTLQVDELNTLGDLVLRCRDSGVQSMVEGPGHVPLDQIETNVILQKRLCHGAPFYVLGPLVTDIAAGWDHITGAIGGALAGWIGVDYLCAVTPAEHLALPSPEEVYAGVMAFRVAAHAADVARRFPGAMERDHAMSRARFNLDWDRQIELAMDPHTMKEVRQERKSETRACTMCGPYCPMDLVKNLSDDEGSQESSD